MFNCTDGVLSFFGNKLQTINPIPPVQVYLLSHERAWGSGVKEVYLILIHTVILEYFNIKE